METNNLLNIVSTLLDLKARPVGTGMMVLLLGKTGIGDGTGGFYRWDSNSSAQEDTAFMNVLISNLSETGRWVRIFQKARTIPQGVLTNNGTIKVAFIAGTTNSSGEITLNLTEENTPTGTPLFTEIWAISVFPNGDATGPATAIQSYKKSLASNLKTLTYGFYKANAVTITLGLLLVPVSSIGAGTTISFRIEGI